MTDKLTDILKEGTKQSKGSITLIKKESKRLNSFNIDEPKQCDMHVVMPSFTEDDLDNVWQNHKNYLIQILNKEYELEEAIEDLRSLIGSKFDHRN